ncbi:hypothetical protein DL767_009853 [Monosporascus sp. MG133]|nr:hypothetical protein DL767_009853 [Monosporascus sp. MG133]
MLLGKIDISAKTKTGRTALVLAAKYGHTAVVQLLLESGGNIAAADSGGWTALHFAARFGNESTVRLLVENHADMEARGKNGRTALSLAAEYGHVAVVQLLLDMGTDITAKDDEGWTALHYASRQANETLVRILIDNGEDITGKCEGGWTALHIAARFGNESTVRLLVENHADMEARGKNGRTALSLAAEYGHVAVVQLLLDMGTDITAKDEECWTAFHYASERRMGEAMRLLANQQNKNRAQSRVQAAEQGDDSVSQTLLHAPADLRTRESSSLLAPPLQDASLPPRSVYAPLLDKRRIRILQLQPDGNVKNHFELLTLLELRRNSKATDPRDKIFSLVGLSIEDYIPEALDYGPDSAFSAEIAPLKDQGFPLQSKYPRTQLTYAAVLYKMMRSQSFGGSQVKAERMGPLNHIPDPEERRPLEPTTGAGVSGAGVSGALPQWQQSEITSETPRWNRKALRPTSLFAPGIVRRLVSAAPASL